MSSSAERYGRKCPSCSKVYDARDGHKCDDVDVAPVKWKEYTPPRESGLADRAHARSTDPDTSYDAAEDATRNLRDSQKEVWSYFEGGVTWTDRELVERMEDDGTKQSRSSIRTRRSELVRAGLVERIGKRKIDGRSHGVYSRKGML